MLYLGVRQLIVLLLLFLAKAAAFTYCIDDKALDIFLPRISGCLGTGEAGTTSTSDIASRVVNEFDYLLAHSAVQFQKSHELLGYLYFVQGQGDAHIQRTPCHEQPDFEYIPMLPLSWRGGFKSSTACTAGGGSDCGRERSTCTWRSLVRDVVAYQKLVEARPTHANRKVPIKFVIAATVNLRSLLGMGMPTQRRQGEVWKTMGDFTQSIVLATYERIGQCPDLLRKGFRHTVEMPYVPLVPSGSRDMSMVDMPRRNGAIYFSGRLKLWGPERVCSPRAMIPELLSSSLDIEVVNVTTSKADIAVNWQRTKDLRIAEFCLVTKADSYTSAFFFNALQAGCIPIVVSDWWVGAFPHTVRYADFVIRLKEDDFLANPSSALQDVLSTIGTDQRKVMRHNMKQWADAMSYGAAPVPTAVGAGAVFRLLLAEASAVVSDSGGWPSYSRCGPKADPLACPASLYVPPLRVGRDKEWRDTRNHLCKHSQRLIGKYKLVLFMQCVRIFWPIKAGNLRQGTDVGASDGHGLLEPEQSWLWNFHNLTRATDIGWRNGWDTYPPLSLTARNKVEIF